MSGQECAQREDNAEERSHEPLEIERFARQADHHDQNDSSGSDRNHATARAEFLVYPHGPGFSVIGRGMPVPSEDLGGAFSHMPRTSVRQLGQALPSIRLSCT